MAAHLQRVRPWTTAPDAAPVWLASKRAVLVSDLYAYVRTLARGVLVDLDAAERAGIVFRGGAPPYEWVMVASTAFDAPTFDGARASAAPPEAAVFRRLAAELRAWLLAAPAPHEVVLSRSGVAPFLASRLVVRAYGSAALPTTSHVRYAVAVHGASADLEWTSNPAVATPAPAYDSGPASQAWWPLCTCSGVGPG